VWAYREEFDELEEPVLLIFLSGKNRFGFGRGMTAAWHFNAARRSMD
jgi:hypothetical protein